jgi:hypothetical protein
MATALSRSQAIASDTAQAWLIQCLILIAASLECFAKSGTGTSFLGAPWFIREDS